MQLKTIKAPVALLVVMVISISAMIMAFVDALPLTSQAFDTPTVVHTRYLRSTEDVTTSWQIDDGGKRRLTPSVMGLEVLEKIPADLHPSFLNNFPRLQARWWLASQRLLENPPTITPTDAFRLLGLRIKTDNFFQSSEFLAWQYYVRKTKSAGETTYKAMYDILKSEFKDKASLVEILGQEMGSNIKTVKSLRQLQIDEWKGLSLNDVSTMMNIEDSYAKGSRYLFSTPEFTMWCEFVDQKFIYFRAFEVLEGLYGNSRSLVKALEKIKGQNKFFASKLIRAAPASSSMKLSTDNRSHP